MIALFRNWMLLFTALIALPGCRAAWPFAASETAVSETTVAAKAPIADLPAPASPAPSVEESQASFNAPSASTPRTPIASATPGAEPTAEQAFSQVLADIEELGRTDAAAQQQLLKQLQTAKPAHYGLVVQQFKAAYAYSRELRERSRPEPPLPMEALPREGFAPVEPASQSDDAHPRLLPQPLGKLDAPRARRIETEEPAEAPSHHAASSLHAIDPRDDRSVDSVTEVSEPAPSKLSGVVHAVYERDAEPAESQVVPASASSPKAEESWEQSLGRAIDGLSIATREPAQSTDELHERLRLRLLELAAGRQEAALAPVDGLSTGEQDYWSKQLFTLATLLDCQAQPDDKRRAAAANVHLAEAANELAELCPLTVRNVVFCSQIHGYGAYEPIATSTFKPGQRLSLYAEVENYRSLSTPQGFHTALSTSYQILDAAGNRSDGNEFPTIDDYCLRHRRDFHTQYGITLPASLTPGKYQLQLTIKDQHANKLGHATTEFEIGGK
ncbi:MAG: hypothetical protein WD851_14905 [Pirellulales bacterium]